MDGLKPGQRKIMFACFKKKLHKEEVKVGFREGGLQGGGLGISQGKAL